MKDWPKRAVVYQIYPRSFKDANKDGVGDLLGIIQQLNYLKGLGINAIWISPIYKSPMADMGYDISDYQGIDPLFGTLGDFDYLVKEAHKNKIKIIMDFVPNHTSSKHPWFLESKSSKNNPKRDWYIWKEPKDDGREPNNWLSIFGGTAWEFDPKTNEYYFHTFDKEQPDLNYRNPEVLQEMLDILRFWLDRGVDGFRIDAPECIYKDWRFLDEPSNPMFQTGQDSSYHSLQHIYTYALPENIEFIKKIADVLEEYKNKFMVTEVWSPMEQLIETYNLVGRDFYTPFNFGLITLPWKAEIHKKYIDKYDEAVGLSYSPTYVLGNHDRHRIASRVGREQARVGAMLQLTLRGIPFIYYGEELGMIDVNIPKDRIKDTYEINSPGLGLGRDPERTPMQWNKQKYAGFSEIKPWLPISPDYQQFNVETETKDPKSFLSLYKKLIKIRASFDALAIGEYKSLDIHSEYIFGFFRSFKEEVFLIILNYSSEQQIIKLGLKGTGIVVCSTYMDQEKKEINLRIIILRPNEGLLIKIK